MCGTIAEYPFFSDMIAIGKHHTRKAAIENVNTNDERR